MTTTETPIAYDIGRHVAKELLAWDLYDSPRQAFDEARGNRFGYNLEESEYFAFKDGVISYFNELLVRKIQ